MRFCRLSLAAILVSIVIVGPASAVRVIVTTDGVHSAQGSVFVGLYASPTKFLNGNQTDAALKVPAKTEPITAVFDNLPPGTYAIGAYHDENGNNHLDTNVIGMPIEGYALSNGVRAVFAKPKFQQAAFIVGEENKTVSLHIRY
jgi:uncharacterized protein (DUF2141 family)